MSACKLSCIRKQNRQTTDGNEISGNEESPSKKSSNPVPASIPGASSGRSTSSGSAVRNPCGVPSCPDRCPKPKNAAKAKAAACLSYVKELWKKTNDPYNWSLLKSVTMFVLGLKLFDDLYKHMAKGSTSCR